MSILKPNKSRQPLQTVNLGDEDEEEDTTEARRRRVSFANKKIKEFDSCAETVVICDTPAYEEDFASSSDSSQILKNVSHHLLVRQALEQDVYGYCDMDVSNIDGGNIQPVNVESQRSHLAPLEEMNNLRRHQEYAIGIRTLPDDHVTLMEDSMDITGIVSPENSLPRISQPNSIIKNMSMDSSLTTSVSFKASIANIQHTSVGQGTIYSSESGSNSDMDMVTEYINKENIPIGRGSLCPTLIQNQNSLSNLPVNASSIPQVNSSYNVQVVKNKGERHSTAPEHLQHSIVTNLSKLNFAQSPSHKRYRLSHLPDSQMDISSLNLDSPKKISLKDSVENMCLTQPILDNKSFIGGKNVFEKSVLTQPAVQTNESHQTLSSQDKYMKEIQYHSFVDLCQSKLNHKSSDEGCPESAHVSMTCVSPLALQPIPKHSFNHDPLVICHNDSECLNETVDLSNLVAEHMHFNNQEQESDIVDKNKNNCIILETSCANKNDSKRKLEEMKGDEVSGTPFQPRVDQVFCDKSVIVKRYSHTTETSLSTGENTDVSNLPPSGLNSFPHSLHLVKKSSVSASEQEVCDAKTEDVKELKYSFSEPVSDSTGSKNSEQLQHPSSLSNLEVESNSKKIIVNPQKLCATIFTENSLEEDQINLSQDLIFKYLVVNEVNEQLPIKYPSSEPTSDSTEVKKSEHLPSSLSNIEAESKKINVSPQKLRASSFTENSLAEDQINLSQGLIVKDMAGNKGNEHSIISPSLNNNYDETEDVQVVNKTSNNEFCDKHEVTHKQLEKSIIEQSSMGMDIEELSRNPIIEEMSSSLLDPIVDGKIDANAKENLSSSILEETYTSHFQPSFTNKYRDNCRVNTSGYDLVPRGSFKETSPCKNNVKNIDINVSVENNCIDKTSEEPITSDFSTKDSEVPINTDIADFNDQEPVNVCIIPQINEKPINISISTRDNLGQTIVGINTQINKETLTSGIATQDNEEPTNLVFGTTEQEPVKVANVIHGDQEPSNISIANGDVEEQINVHVANQVDQDPINIVIANQEDQNLIGVVNESVVNMSFPSSIENDNQMEIVKENQIVATKEDLMEIAGEQQMNILESKSPYTSVKTALSDTKNPGDVFSPMQLHNKHFMENLGYHFCNWTKWIKHFFHGAVILQVIVPWIELDSQTPIESAIFELSEQKKSAALSFYASDVVKKLNNMDFLLRFKTLQDTINIFSEIPSFIEEANFYFVSVEELLRKSGTTKLSDGRLIFNFANIRTGKCAHVYIDLKNWNSLSRNDVSIITHGEKISLSGVKNLFFSLPSCKERFYEFACAFERLIAF